MLLPISLLLVATAPAGGVVSPSGCEARFASAPEAEESALCFLETAERQPASWAESVRRVEGLLRRHPQHPWLTFYLGSLHWNRDPRRAAELYQQAAGLFARRHEAIGEVRARSNRYWQLLAQDREREAAAEVGLAVRAGEASGQPLALARARILEATHLSEHRQDLQRADRLLLDAEELLGPEGPYRMRRDCLLQQGNVASGLGRLDEARRRFERLVDLTVREGDLFGEASARYNLLRVVRDELAVLPRPEGRSLSLELARRTLQVAEAAGHLDTVSKTHAVLGLVTRGAEAREHFQRCFAAAAEAEDKSFCRSAQARSLTREDPAAAPAALDEALDLARKAEDPWALAYFWRERMRVSWRLDPPDVAVRDSLAALDAIEAMRDLQTGETGRAEVFSTWAGHYHWLAGRLLQEHSGRGRHLELSFQVQERMRARALIDALEAVRAAPAISPESLKLQARRAAVLAEISQLQRRLLDHAETRRSGLLAELRRKEREEEDLRERIAKASPEFSALRRPGFATLEQVRGALAGDEALLSFQIAPWQDMVGDFMGGAWLTVVTRERVAVHPLRAALASRTSLRPAVESFAGGLKGGGDNPKGAAALYQALLADGLARLGPGVRKLVVVPDDVLHRLPFAALRPEAAAPPLAVSYEVTLVPSATLWLRWREGRPPAPEIPALVLVDPISPATVKVAAAERSAALAVPPSLGELPWARREGMSVIDALGGELRMGEEASEAFLKKDGADRFGILHFATHALTDDVEPDRSFVLLAPGDSREDGLLQVREIAGLDLQGQMVVLASCSSASGEILRGEGVMGLARAFFQAGAHTVVASLWPLRDDHGAALFERFYRHLADGRSVAAALRAAQQDRFEAGAPPEAWAGVVVLGDGGRVPVPGGRRPGWATWALVLGLIAVLAAALAAQGACRARQRRRTIE